MITAKGRNGTVEFDGRTITITRMGLLARSAVGKGSKQIPLPSMTAVQFKPATALVYGYIEFTLPGGSEIRSRAGHATKDQAHNENAVVFTKKQMPEFEGLKLAIDEARRAREDAQYAPVPQQPSGLAAELANLAALRAQGVLSDQEFDAAKARLIAG